MAKQDHEQSLANPPVFSSDIKLQFPYPPLPVNALGAERTPADLPRIQPLSSLLPVVTFTAREAKRTEAK